MFYDYQGIDYAKGFANFKLFFLQVISATTNLRYKLLVLV